MVEKKEKAGLELLREPFPPNQISKLPKPTKAQTDAVRANFKAGTRCDICGSWHHPNVVHLDYVGHAALTDRLLDCDPKWNWEPVATNEDGTPKIDGNGGMWIKLTVCDVTRLGYGHPDGKKGGDALKEVIGDALRNAAMRFGAALDLWHKGALHAEEDAPTDDAEVAEAPVAEKNSSGHQRATSSQEDEVWAPPGGETPFDGQGAPAVDERHEADVTRETAKIATIADMDELASYWKVMNKAQPAVVADPRVIAAKDERKTAILRAQKENAA